jgi:hypothetical protein
MTSTVGYPLRLKQARKAFITRLDQELAPTPRSSSFLASTAYGHDYIVRSYLAPLLEERATVNFVTAFRRSLIDLRLSKSVGRAATLGIAGRFGRISQSNHLAKRGHPISGESELLQANFNLAGAGFHRYVQNIVELS